MYILKHSMYQENTHQMKKSAESHTYMFAESHTMPTGLLYR